MRFVARTGFALAAALFSFHSTDVDAQGLSSRSAPHMRADPPLSLSDNPRGRTGSVPREASMPQNGMRFEFGADGRLTASGTITFGTAEAFAAEIARHGDKVKTVVLRSPGGSVEDALAMGRLIRQKGIATEVGNGHLCASSCPLVFAGGVERRAAEKAHIGVHQVIAVSESGAQVREADGGRGILAICRRYLTDMGVDPQVWTHASKTPHQRLYRFNGSELIGLKLATSYGASYDTAGSTSVPVPPPAPARR